MEAALEQPAGRRDGRGQGHDRLHLHAPQAGGRQPRRALPSGVRVTQPTEGQLAALADATAPVRAALRGNDATGPVLKALEATLGAGPQALEAPSECSKPVPARVVAKAGPASIRAGRGLSGPADRVAAVGGELRIQSPAGAGTIVEARLPLR